MRSPDARSSTSLPIPDQPHVGLTTFDARDPDTSYPPIRDLRRPADAPNVLVVLLDDVGFGASSTFGGPCNTPNLDKVAAGGLKYNRFHRWPPPLRAAERFHGNDQQGHDRCVRRIDRRRRGDDATIDGPSMTDG